MPHQDIYALLFYANYSLISSKKKINKKVEKPTRLANK